MNDEWDTFTQANLMLAEAGSIGVSLPTGTVLRRPVLVDPPTDTDSASSSNSPYEDVSSFLKRKGR